MAELTEREHHFAERVDSRCAEEKGLALDVLCASCEHGQVMRRRGKLDVIVWCHRGFDSVVQVPSDIVECSEYKKKGALSVHQMEKLAIEVDGRTGVNNKAYL